MSQIINTSGSLLLLLAKSRNTLMNLAFRGCSPLSQWLKSRNEMTTSKQSDQANGIPEAVRDLLRQHPVFSHIRQINWARLLASSRIRKLAAGETICREGDSARVAWLVLNGEIKLLRHTAREQVLLVDIILPDEMFGVVFYHQAPVYPCTGVALKTSRLLCFPLAVFVDELIGNPSLEHALLEDTCLKLCQSIAMRGYALEDLAVRIARILLRLQEKFGAVVPETRATLAELAGSTPESAIRVTRDFEDRGILRLGRGRIEILSLEKLARMAGARAIPGHYHVLGDHHRSR